MATIKGKWVFNESINVSTNTTYSVNFISAFAEFVNDPANNTDKYTAFVIDTTGYDGKKYLTYRASTNGANLGVLYHAVNGWNTTKDWRAVDFGTTEQAVSDAFYNWFTTNATPQAEPTPTDEVTIEYNGAVIASLKAGQSATLHCMGDNVKMLTDIVITVPSSMGGVELISFTIGGTSYQAESGMTWADWCDSSYNTRYWFVVGNRIKRDELGTLVVVQGVTPTQVIQSDYSYSSIQEGGSSN